MACHRTGAFRSLVYGYTYSDINSDIHPNSYADTHADFHSNAHDDTHQDIHSQPDDHHLADIQSLSDAITNLDAYQKSTKYRHTNSLGWAGTLAL